MKPVITSILMLLCTCVYCQQYILIRNAEIFNGTDNETTLGNVLIKDNLIHRVSSSPIEIPAEEEVHVIEGEGLFLMPGLIDAHVHLMFQGISMMTGLTADLSYATLVAADQAKKQLLRGFTTVRDLGGNTFSLKRAIDQGLYMGPRIYPSGATISQTGGHGDFGLPTDVPRQIGGQLTYIERSGMTIIADGADQVLMRAREQLRQGASQIKVMAGGGVTSSYDPLDVSQYTEREIRAAVDAAESWNTYVTVHAYTPKAIQTAIRAGVRCIDHGQLLDEETMKMIAERDIWLSLQPFMGESRFPEGSPNRVKQVQMYEGTGKAYELAKKYGVKIAFGTDILFDPVASAQQNSHLLRLTKWFSPYEILRMATSENAELLALSGPRNPYPAGPLGIIEEGAYADLILIDGNPLENLETIADPEENFITIIKNGKIAKNLQ